jgi:hypothetical protein
MPRVKRHPPSKALLKALAANRTKTRRCPKCGSFVRRGETHCPNGHRFARAAAIGKKLKYATAC